MNQQKSAIKGVKQMKVLKKPFVALRPVPVVLVSCGHGERANIITIAWTGILCSSPPQVGIGVRPDRHSHGLIQETGEFVVNVPGEGLLDEVEYCGFVSGREVDKFAARGLTPVPGSAVQTPIIAECPINIECRVSHTLSLGSHDLFIGEVVAVQLSQEALDERGRVDGGKLKPILFTGDEYWGLGSLLGRYGFSRR
jgi:flavin reductase (DIM6/NTAB) family NADH-FMN oxidoreductase RutF